MVTICQKCGDIGFSVALIYCDKCQVVAEHRYCLDKLPATFTEYVTWFCEDCAPKVAKPSPDKAIPAPVIKSDRLTKSAKVFLARKLVKRSIEARAALKRKRMSGPATITEVQKHENTHLQPCEACGSGIHKGDQKLDKQRRLMLIDNANIEEKAESSKLLKDQNREEAESSKISNDHKIGEAESSKINQNQKLEVSKSSKFRNDVRLEEVDSNAINENHKIGEAESSKISNDHKIGEAELEVSKSSKFRNDVRLEEVDSNAINENQKLDESESSRSVDLKLENKRRSALEDKGNTDQDADSCNINTNDIDPAQPIVDPVWRGRFSICDTKFSCMDGLAAHLSTKACLKVCEEARLLPELLFSEMLPKDDVWPKSFRSSEPTDDHHIALYFFPENERDESGFDSLVEYMIEEDLAMRAVAANAELLVFTSIQLPLRYWRYQAKYYLWGVFRKKLPSFSQQQEGHFMVQNDSNKSIVTTAVSTAEGRDRRKTLSWDRRSPISPSSKWELRVTTKGTLTAK